MPATVPNSWPRKQCHPQQYLSLIERASKKNASAVWSETIAPAEAVQVVLVLYRLNLELTGKKIAKISNIELQSCRGSKQPEPHITAYRVLQFQNYLQSSMLHEITDQCAIAAQHTLAISRDTNQCRVFAALQYASCRLRNRFQSMVLKISYIITPANSLKYLILNNIPVNGWKTNGI